MADKFYKGLLIPASKGLDFFVLNAIICIISCTNVKINLYISKLELY